MVYSGRLAPGADRRLNKHAGTILIGGIFLCFSFMLYMTLCNMPCEDQTYAIYREDLELARSHSYWKKHIFSPKKSQSASLVILVLTGPKHLDRRDVMRETWLNNIPDTVKVKFSIGIQNLSEPDRVALEREHSVHKDLLFLNNVQESYSSLASKLLQSFSSLDKNIDFQHLLKVDDDSFVNLEPFLKALESKSKERLYWGFFDGRAHVKRTGQWREKDWILCDRYLPYALGGGYVLSADLIHFISINSKYLKLYISEDVSVGTWLGPLDIDRIHDPRFDTEYKSRGCNNKYLITHKQEPSDMRHKFNNLKHIGKLCRKEERSRLSYIYNWNVAPTSCCHRNDSSVP